MIPGIRHRALEVIIIYYLLLFDLKYYEYVADHEYEQSKI